MCIHSPTHTYFHSVPSNQVFDKQIPNQWRGGGVSRVRWWVRMATELSTRHGGHSTMLQVPNVRWYNVLCTHSLTNDPHTHTHAHTHACTHAHTHMSTHTHTHTHTHPQLHIMYIHPLPTHTHTLTGVGGWACGGEWYGPVEGSGRGGTRGRSDWGDRVRTPHHLWGGGGRLMDCPNISLLTQHKTKVSSLTYTSRLHAHMTFVLLQISRLR